MYYCYFSSVFVMMVYTYLLLAGLLVTLLPSTFATSLYTRDRQAFGLCYEEDCLSAHFSYNPYGCHGKVSSIVHVNVQVIYLRSLKDDYFQTTKIIIVIGRKCTNFSKMRKLFLKENFLKLIFLQLSVRKKNKTITRLDYN